MKSKCELIRFDLHAQTRGAIGTNSSIGSLETFYFLNTMRALALSLSFMLAVAVLLCCCVSAVVTEFGDGHPNHASSKREARDLSEGVKNDDTELEGYGEPSDSYGYSFSLPTYGKYQPTSVFTFITAPESTSCELPYCSTFETLVRLMK